ncbi:sensor histidine kinase [Qipengyuania sp. ASV99]|uniref:sensor histidine kinase n=1 Tax=Qipengyuania sp. ASV99 TaxID=3399681 RepID=UPI003A4C55FB
MNTSPKALAQSGRSDKLSVTEPALWPPGKAPAEEFCGEDKRLRVLASFDAGALSGDAELARITRFAAQLCNASSAAVSLVEAESQRFIAGAGLTQDETPRTTSLCAHTMLGSDLLEVLDASGDARFANFELVRGAAGLRYYAGAPLISAEGAPLGALCVTDTAPRSAPLSTLQREGLMVLAEAVMRRLHSHREANAAGMELKKSAEQLQFMLNSVPDIAWSAAAGPKFDYFNARFTEVTGLPPRQSIDDWRDVIHPDDFEASLVKLRQAMSTATFFDDEWRLKQADGSYRWVISRAVPSSDDPQTARWFGTLTDIHDRHMIAEERELLAGELVHRIKNIFAVVTGLVTLHARGDPALKDFADTLSENIRALSRAQEFALRAGGRAGRRAGGQAGGHDQQTLKDLLEVLMAPYGVPGKSAIAISGAEVATGPRSATPLALVFHELATNSAKYGALSVAQGRLFIDIRREEQNVRIIWRETGGPAATAPQEVGFGSRLMRLAVENQLGGTISQDWQSDGLVSEIIVPAERLER